MNICVRTKYADISPQSPPFLCLLLSVDVEAKSSVNLHLAVEPSHTSGKTD
jgi:hypothetical protein